MARITKSATLAGIKSVRSSLVFRETAWLTVAKAVQGLSGFAATMIVATSLGPSEYGNLALASAIASFAASVSALGLEQIFIREASQPDSAGIEHQRALTIIVRLRIAGAVAGTIILFLASITNPAEQYGLTTLLMTLSILPLAQVGDVAEWRLLSTGSAKKIAAAYLAVSPAAALARISGAYFGVAVEVLAWTIIAEFAIRSLTFALLSPPAITKPPPQFDDFMSQSRKIINESLPLLAATVAVIVYMRVDQFMIAAMLGPEPTGHYAAIIAIVELCVVLPALVLRAALPQLTREIARNPAEFDRRLVVLLRAAFYGHLLLAAVMATNAEFLLASLLGPEFAPAVKTFQIAVFLVPFAAIGTISSAWIILNRRTAHAFRRTLIGALANVALNLALIPSLGLKGAALSTIAAQLIATFLADAMHHQSRDLFRIKCTAIFFTR